MATPAEGPFFGVAPSGTWTWMSRSANKDGLMPKATARERTLRRCRPDRLLHHVAQVAGRRHAALAGHMVASVVSNSPPTSVQASPVTTPIRSLTSP